MPSVACSKASPEASEASGASSASSGSVAAPSASSTAFAGPLAPADNLRFVDAPAAGDVPTIVLAEMAKAKADNRKVIVYVGAKWCEPCQRFHHAAERGELDGQIGNVTFVTFDLDRDGDRLKDAGYASQYIPLFAIPDAMGLGNERRMEGSIKGDGAVNQIVPRLRALLAKS